MDMSDTPRVIVFDIETSNMFQETGSGDPVSLDLSVVCIHDSLTDEYSSYLQEDLPKLWPILEQADILVGYNSDHFDIPILDKYYSGDLRQIKSIDLLAEIKNSLGRRLKLDGVAQATIGAAKSADGLMAIRWWREGKKQQVIDYCLQDVKVTKEVFEYALKHNKLKYKDMGKVAEIKLNTSTWLTKDIKAMTGTLPF